VALSTVGSDACDGVPRCLAFTANRSARDRVRAALALDGRMRCVAPASREHLAISRHGIYSIVIIDLPSLVGDWRQDGLSLIEQWARWERAVVIACGQTEDADEEQTVRMLGAGVYLPGAPLDAAVDVAMRSWLWQTRREIDGLGRLVGGPSAQ